MTVDINPDPAAYRAKVEDFEREQNRLDGLRAMQNRLSRTETADDFLLRAAPRPAPHTSPSTWPLVIAVVALGALLGVAIGVSAERAWAAHNAADVARVFDMEGKQ